MGLWEIIKGEQPGIIKSILNYENLGQFGEFSTEYALTNNNLDGELVVLKNIYVPYRDKTSEIDLLMIHEKGIFVFESKNYNGWIYGKGWEKNWTQLFPLGKGLSEKIQFFVYHIFTIFSIVMQHIIIMIVRNLIICLLIVLFCTGRFWFFLSCFLICDNARFAMQPYKQPKCTEGHNSCNWC